MQAALSGTKRRGPKKLVAFNSGTLGGKDGTKVKSYKRKRPSKKQKREWEKEKQRLAKADGSDDEGGTTFE